MGKIVRQNNRRTKQEKLNAALAKKPTAAYLNRQGFSPDINIPEKKQKLIQRNSAVIRNNDQRKRFVTKPNRAFATSKEQPTIPVHSLHSVPDWFYIRDRDIDVSIIVPMYKSDEVILEQIASWDLTDDGLKKEIIYVDDCCPRKSYIKVLEAWEKRKDELKTKVGKIFVNLKNGGFGCACNIGANEACGKYLLFLNADTTVTPNWIRPLYDSFKEQENLGIVGNLQLRKGDVIDSCGSEWDWHTNCFLHIGKSSYHGKQINRSFTMENIPADLLQPQDVQMVTGACFMIPKPLFEELNGFDINYQVGYWEDSDLNMRVRAAGHRVFYQPNSKIYHKVSHSGVGYHSHMNDNRRLFQKKWVDTKIIEAFVPPPRPRKQIQKESIVAYTAITKNYDILKDQPKHGVDFVAFTDQQNISKTWEIRPIHKEFNDANRNAKIHKILPHIYFPDKEYSLWIDGSVNIEFPFGLEKLVEIYLNDVDIALFNHPDRHCIYQEAAVCIQKKLDDPDVIRNQIQRYTKAGYPANFGLVEATILLRRHTPKIKQFNEMWWDEIQKGSKRDQISFNYVARNLGLKYNFFPGNLRKKNFLFKRDLHYNK